MTYIQTWSSTTQKTRKIKTSQIIEIDDVENDFCTIKDNEITIHSTGKIIINLGIIFYNCSKADQRVQVLKEGLIDDVMVSEALDIYGHPGYTVKGLCGECSEVVPYKIRIVNPKGKFHFKFMSSSIDVELLSEPEGKGGFPAIPSVTLSMYEVIEQEMNITKEDLQEIKEKSWIEGERAALKNQLKHALEALGYDEEFTREKLIVERVETITALRNICDEFGDNDWDEDLYLPDVISKHLDNHLRNKD